MAGEMFNRHAKQVAQVAVPMQRELMKLKNILRYIADHDLNLHQWALFEAGERQHIMRLINLGALGHLLAI